MSYRFGGGKSIKLLVDFMYAEDLFPASWTAILLCPQGWRMGRGSPDSLQRGANPIYEGSA